MNKTIKVIDLLNKIANREELPKRILYQHKIYSLNSEKQYFEEEADEKGYRNIFGYDNELTYVLNDYVEILEDNTEEIEELEYEESKMYCDTQLIESTKTAKQEDIIDKINELVKAVNSIRKDLNK